MDPNIYQRFVVERDRWNMTEDIIISSFYFCVHSINQKIYTYEYLVYVTLYSCINTEPKTWMKQNKYYI
ncbi:hypothetical protein RJT34_23421 [Clitoria ternatea]|uniref:Uncharacterized protein n=1 Tax=Clitoria ternatea TaxID=43366 RepID=A0AAN9IEY5_CLITE